MKLLLLSVFFLFSQIYAVAQYPFPIKNKSERGIKPVVRTTQNKVHPGSAIRDFGNGISTLLEYDAFGNLTSNTSETDRLIRQYDPTGKYLIREVSYLRNNYDDPFILYRIGLETTFDAQGVRTGINGDEIKEAVFDNRGRATKVVWKHMSGDQQEYTVSVEYSWSGDKLTRLEYIDNYPREYQHYIYSNFDYAFETSHFNPMNLDLIEDLTDSEYCMLIGFDIIELDRGEDISTGLKAQAKVSVNPDGRGATRTLTEMPEGEPEKVVMKEHVLLIDDYGSMKQTTEFYEAGTIYGHVNRTCMYNEYGDCISEVFEEKDGDYESHNTEYYVRTYAADGHPQSTSLYNSLIAPENILWTEYYDGYIPSSVSSDMADNMVSVYKNAEGKLIINALQTQVYGVEIYRVDGLLIYSQPARDVIQPVILPSNGLYIVKVSTPSGQVVKKVMN